MAEHLANIFGTEKDRVNCPFFFKIGACRHGERCSRIHNKPTISCTLLMPNMYQSPATIMTPTGPSMTDPRQLQEHFEDFYEDIFEELDKFGEVESLAVCDNLADHLVGNVYVKFRDEEPAGQALLALQGRYYSGRPIVVEFSPVTDFREATCRQYEEHTCNRGGYCNFMHLKPISKELKKRLFGRYRRRSPSRSPERDRRGGGGGGGGRHGEHGRAGGGRGGGGDGGAGRDDYGRRVDDRPRGGGGRGGGGGGGGDDRYGDRYGPGGGGDRYPARPRSRSRERERGERGGGADGGRGGDRDRSRDRDRGDRGGDRVGGDHRDTKEPETAKGMSDEARRAMIAQWAAQAAAPGGGGGGGGGGGSGGGGSAAADDAPPPSHAPQPQDQQPAVEPQE